MKRVKPSCLCPCIWQSCWKSILYKNYIKENFLCFQQSILEKTELISTELWTSVGLLHIFISERAASQVKIIERCYISGNEREYYKNIRLEESKLGDDKVKLAKRQYRGQGRYIDEILE